MQPTARSAFNLLLKNSPGKLLSCNIAVVLRQKCTNWVLETEQAQLNACLEGMKSAIRNSTGYHKDTAVTMSCPQVGVAKRAFIMVEPKLWKTSGSEKYQSFLHFINPVVQQTSPHVKLHWEGCPSFPEYSPPLYGVARSCWWSGRSGCSSSTQTSTAMLATSRAAISSVE